MKTSCQLCKYIAGLCALVTEHHQGVKPQISGFVNQFTLVATGLGILGGENGFGALLAHLFQNLVQPLVMQTGHIGRLRIGIGFAFSQYAGELGEYIVHDINPVRIYLPGLLARRPPGARLLRGTPDKNSSRGPYGRRCRPLVPPAKPPHRHRSPAAARAVFAHAPKSLPCARVFAASANNTPPLAPAQSAPAPRGSSRPSSKYDHWRHLERWRQPNRQNSI